MSGASAAGKSAGVASKLDELRRRREDAKKDNLTEVTEEDRRAKEDPREDARRARRLKVAKELLAKEEAEAQGLDYARIKAMDKNVEQVDWEVKTKEKRQRNATIGFASFQDEAEKKYKRLTKAMKPDLEHYQQHKASLGAAAFPTADSIVHTDMVPLEKSRVDALVENLRQQDLTRSKMHKRRRFDPNAEVDYINESNANFNRKISKAFDPYTREVKANLERGTAL